jgi:hypothetical protein
VTAKRRRERNGGAGGRVVVHEVPKSPSAEFELIRLGQMVRRDREQGRDGAVDVEELRGGQARHQREVISVGRDGRGKIRKGRHAGHGGRKRIALEGRD